MFDGSRLKEIRVINKLSQKETAKLLNITPSTLNRYEKNERIPSVDFLVDFSLKFGVQIKWLINFPEVDLVEEEYDQYGEPAYTNPCYRVLSKTEWDRLTSESIDYLSKMAHFILIEQETENKTNKKKIL
ncbi:helix-turn-helix domain-containing protein [Fusibacter tunisiensis]|uniref:Transcriptional regulator with XRE-family HTH domain n=1 Tax=Fusibacter tunisiensis TaxID=1008308 RepID=A0ABS2MPL5_9FIRM|nr:helix-turn-helix transcriptional regulator [Fusibacter tunisiensis]MBM7561340.1 transcriptional regulator with XRE-family HTH domain [Fusibacter tunisiensis]